MKSKHANFASGAILFGILQIVASSSARGTTLTLTSPSFVDGQSIPARYTCSGANESPALRWSGVPKETRSLVLMVEDPDAPMGTFVHWNVYDISPKTAGLSENARSSAQLGGGEQGINGRGEAAYAAPCPPPGKPHHYHFRLFAVDQNLGLQSGAPVDQVRTALNGHVLATADLVGIFGR
jgi:Raf kinase inhibitor-like YbhB/YbcL family protein